MIRQVTADLRVAFGAIQDGEEVDADAIEELLLRGQRAASGSADADVRSLLDAVQDLEKLIRERFQEVGEELRRLAQGRQALRGYNHLRGASEGQRLYRRA